VAAAAELFAGELAAAAAPAGGPRLLLGCDQESVPTTKAGQSGQQPVALLQLSTAAHAFVFDLQELARDAAAIGMAAAVRPLLTTSVGVPAEPRTAEAAGRHAHKRRAVSTASKVLGWPRRCKLAHAFPWECS
jgi:hypothetical protein